MIYVINIYIYPLKDSNPEYKELLQIYKKTKGNSILKWQKPYRHFT